MELTRGRGPFPNDMAKVEVPYDMKQMNEMDVRGKIVLITHFKISGKRLFGIKIRPFLDRKEQLHLLFWSYLPVHRFIADLSVPRTTTFLSLGRPQLPLYATCHLYNTFYEDGYF